jgi:hypothetical protein
MREADQQAANPNANNRMRLADRRECSDRKSVFNVEIRRDGL